MKSSFFMLVALSISLSLIQPISSSSSPSDFTIDGRVLELNDSNFDAAISYFDYIFVDFYAPWCTHCKRLSPELDKAAPILAGLKEPVVIAKVDADKYSSIATKYEIDGFPTLKIFMHGVPTDYYGSRKADYLVHYLKKFVAADVAVLKADSDINDFIEAAGVDFPIFVGFGLDEASISALAIKYKRKAWFSVAKDFSEDAMVLYNVDKVPALAALHPKYDEQHIFYGPFEDEFLEDFVKQNLLPLVVPISSDTLRLLKDDERKVVLTFVEDEEDETTKKLLKLLGAAASANRDLVFGYVGFKQWEGFAESFEITKKTKLPKMVVWDGDEDYFSVVGSDSIKGGEEASQISLFLEGYKSGNVVKKQIAGATFMGFLNSLIGVRTVFIFVFVVAAIMLIQTITKEDLPSSLPPPRDDASTPLVQGQDTTRSGEKED